MWVFFYQERRQEVYEKAKKFTNDKIEDQILVNDPAYIESGDDNDNEV